MTLFKKYYCVRQQDITDCGAACIATVLKQFGSKIPVSKIREIAGTDNEGTSAFGLMRAAKELKFNAKGVKLNHDEFFSHFPLPCIAHVVIDNTLEHYVVIHSIEKNRVIISDPAKGILKYKPEKFFEIWTGVLIIMTPNYEFEKKNETKGLFKRFFGLLIPQKKLITHVFLASMLYTLLGILGAFYFKVLLDDILPYGLERTLHLVTIAIILLNIFQIILGAFRRHLLLYLSQRIDIPMMLGYYNHVLDLPMNFFGTRKVGEIISRFTDASSIRDAISGATLTIMIDTIMAVAGGIILYIYNATLFLVASVMLVLYAILVFSFNKPTKEANQILMEANSQLTSYLIESLNGIETVKTFNSEEECKLKAETKFVKLLKIIFKIGMIDNLRDSLSNTIGTIGEIIILWVGAINVMNGSLTIGQLLVFNSLLAYFTEPVSNLIDLQPMIQTAVVASDRLGEILDLEIEKTKSDKSKLHSKSLIGDIDIKNLNFRYGTRALTLKDVNISIKSGERIALVGESGSGKTTLVKLLLNLYEPESGEILINNNNIKDIGFDTLRNKISYVPQNTFLFSGTIEENLRFGSLNLTMDDIIEASKLSKAHEFINELPLRYNTRLEENGSNLSGGQRQRLSITRAILKNPDILILDEATSSLDSLTEKAIEKTLNNLSSNITSVVIAHRLSTIMRCDKIYVMDKGTIIECGSHKELIGKKGHYYEMWREQLPENTD